MPDRITPDHFGHSHPTPGHIVVISPADECLARMMGKGAGWNDQKCTKEVEGFVAGGIDRVAAENFVAGLANGGLTEDEALARILAKDAAPGALQSLIVDDETLPSDHQCDSSCEFFNAWEWTGAVTVNMPKARGVHMDVIRAVRNKELAKKDLTSLQAIEASDTDAQVMIATEKQTLRDIPQTFDLTTDNDTPEELKQKWPEGLPKE